MDALLLYVFNGSSYITGSSYSDGIDIVLGNIAGANEVVLPESNVNSPIPSYYYCLSIDLTFS